MDRIGAFKAGWQASKRTRTYDLDAAEARFEARHGTHTGTAFAAGWTAYATGFHTDWTDALKEYLEGAR